MKLNKWFQFNYLLNKKEKKDNYKEKKIIYKLKNKYNK